MKNSEQHIEDSAKHIDEMLTQLVNMWKEIQHDIKIITDDYASKKYTKEFERELFGDHFNVN